jgi:cytochrome c peroxidase
MNKNKQVMSLLIVLLLAGWGIRLNGSDEKPPPPITQLNAQVLGPQRLGPLPAVVTPPNNPQSSAKIMLGKQLYFDTRLSKDNTISCATCHDPALGWSDKGPTSKGIAGQMGGRRSPPVSNSAYNPLQFWDGRSPSLEDQAKGPIQNPIEMGNTHQAMIRTVADIPGYVEEFRRVFGEGPITVQQVADAIAAFERTVVTTDSKFDRYARGDHAALTKLEKQGLEVFNGKGHCSACHWGANFSDGRFHNLGVPAADPKNPDQGRYAVTKNPADMGAFKTPTMRDASLRAPYLHDGSEKTLESVIDFYNRGAGKDANLDPLMVPLGLTRLEKKALVAFIKALVSLNPEVAAVTPVPVSELPK